MEARIFAVDRVLVRCRECIEEKNSMASTNVGRAAYKHLQPVISIFGKEASELTSSVQEVQELAKVVQSQHQTLTHAYGTQKSLEKAKIKQAELRLKGKLLDIRKAKIAFALYRLEAMETVGLKGFESDLELCQVRFDEFKKLVDRVQECSTEMMAPLIESDSQTSPIATPDPLPT